MSEIKTFWLIEARGIHFCIGKDKALVTFNSPIRLQFEDRISAEVFIDEHELRKTFDAKEHAEMVKH